MDNETKWLREGRTVYELMHHSWKAGVEQFCNRWSFNVQGPSVPDPELEAIAELARQAPELLAQRDTLLVALTEAKDTLNTASSWLALSGAPSWAKCIHAKFIAARAAIAAAECREGTK